jgi:hypothetical protein
LAIGARPYNGWTFSNRADQHPSDFLNHRIQIFVEFVLMIRTLSLLPPFLALVASVCVGAAQAQVSNYHVGSDNLPTLASGTYAGLPNPNYQRLTFLRFNDLEVSDPVTSHWHAIGTYAYTGPAGSPSVQSTSGNNRIPETLTGFSPLNLHPGSGVFAGKLVSGIADASPQSHDHYDRLEMRSVQDLASASVGSVENYLYNSSGGRWNQPLGANAQIALQLLSHTPGLGVAATSGTSILANDNDIVSIGQGDGWAFTPVFWVVANVAPGTYSATLRLIDQSGTFQPSGTFNLDFAVVPEPASAALVVGALVAGVAIRRRRRA